MIELKWLINSFTQINDKNSFFRSDFDKLSGTSNLKKQIIEGLSESEIREAYNFAHENNLIPPSMEQPQYNLLDKERFEIEYDALYKDFGMGTTTWSPLASGALTGKYLNGIPDNSRASLSGYEWLKKSMIESDRGQERMARVAKLKDYADDLGVNLAQLSIAWCLLNENVSTVILGASKASQLVDNLKCIDLLPIFTAEVQEKLRKLS